MPAVQGYYAIPQKLYEPCLREIERLVRLGVIEPDKDSRWAALAFVIAKKDGSVRLLTDFRKLNKKIVRS